MALFSSSHCLVSFMRRIKVQSLLLIVIIDNKNLLVGWLSLEHSHLGIQKLLKCKIEYIIHKINPTSLSLSLSLSSRYIGIEKPFGPTMEEMGLCVMHGWGLLATWLEIWVWGWQLECSEFANQFGWCGFASWSANQFKLEFANWFGWWWIRINLRWWWLLGFVGCDLHNKTILYTHTHTHIKYILVGSS